MFLLHPFRSVLRIVALLVVGVVAYFGVTLVQVWITSGRNAPVHADAIVVMGAAQYNGVPSPDLASRLQEAWLLYHEGYAHLVGVTGSKQQGDRFTEAESGAAFLEKRGVPAADVIQAGGSDSWENISQLASGLRVHGVRTVDMVTDPFHEDRSMAIASSFGFSPSPSPTRTSPIRGLRTVPYFLKEAVGVGLGRVIGFQRLHALG